MTKSVSLEEMAKLLDQSPDYRVLRRYVRPKAYRPPDKRPKRFGLIVDCETTGFDLRMDEIIEIGAVLFEYDLENGDIYRILDVYEAFEDPGRPIPEEIVRLTGITDAMVAGQHIDEIRVDELAGRAHLVIAHNAAFDRPFFERRLPSFAAKPWACSMQDIDWQAENIGSAKLDYLAYRFGFFFDGHRASSDCLATLHILAQALPVQGTTGFAALRDAARRPHYRIWALNSPIENKSELKRRGYRWNPGEDGWARAWYIDCRDEASRDREMTFLRTLSETEPVCHEIEAVDRYSIRPSSRS